MTGSTGRRFAAFLICLCLSPAVAYPQGYGGMGGSYSGASSEGGGVWNPTNQLPVLPPEKAMNYITVDGTADIRVVPDEIRVVLAITAEGESAKECKEKAAAQVGGVVKAWEELEIDDENIVEDFINVLPRYEWRVTERDGEKFRIQQHEGFRIQTNLHVAVKTEAEAMEAINLAFEQGVTEIVTFDYWSSKVNESQVEARKAAIEAAKEKAEILLAVFDQPPQVINVQENTAVFAPHSLYHTYENVLEEGIRHAGGSTWINIPSIQAYRPKKTFFHGLQSQSDRRPTGAPMRPEIAVVSTVRIYYESPAKKTFTDKGN